MLTSKRQALLKRIFWSPPFVPDTSTGPICSICNKVVVLENANTDESGAAVHEECYVSRLKTGRCRREIGPGYVEAFPVG